MLGLNLFKHALVMIVRNWVDSLKLTVATAITLVIGATGIGLFVDVPDLTSLDAAFDATSDVDGPEAVGDASSAIVGGLAMGLLMFVCYAGLAANWHRFVLLAEYPSWFRTPFHCPSLGRYLIASVKVVSVFALLIFCNVTLLALLMGAGFPSALVTAAMTASISISLVTCSRIALILPATAVSQSNGTSLEGPERDAGTRPGHADTGNANASLTMREAMEATRGQFWPILVSIGLVFAFGALVESASTILWSFGDLVGALGALALTPFSLLIGASLCTTLYGHYVEGRELE